MAGARTPFDENGLGYWPARSCEMVVKLLGAFAIVIRPSTKSGLQACLMS
jgi:hypothetical protein